MNLILNILFIFSIINIHTNAQVRPVAYPLSNKIDIKEKTIINDLNFSFSTKNKIRQFTLNLETEELYIFSIKCSIQNNISIFILNEKNGFYI